MTFREFEELCRGLETPEERAERLRHERWVFEMIAQAVQYRNRLYRETLEAPK